MASAMAADWPMGPSLGCAVFGSIAPLLACGDELITFTNLASVTCDLPVSITSQCISDLGATLNSQPLTALLLSATGTTITSPMASYLVTMSATPVPEPETCALMLAGLGVVGFLACRRRAA